MRAIWSGTISFGLVVIPVQLLPATRDNSISFHQLHKEDLARIRYKKVCALDDRPVKKEDIVQAYEYEKGRYVTITPEEIAGADPEMTRTIEILDFVESTEIDPVFFARPYLLSPGAGADKACVLFAQALEEVGRVAIGKCVIRTKQYLVALRPKNDRLVLETMRYADEVRDPAEISVNEQIDVTKHERDLAKQLISQMSGKFTPGKYRDDFRAKILAIVDKKVSGREVALPREPEAVAPVADLATALKDSLKQLKKTG